MKKNYSCQELKEENAMHATWLALGIVTSVPDEDPQASQLCVHVRM